MQALASDAWRLRTDVVNTMIEELTTLGLQIQGHVNPNEVVEVKVVGIAIPDGWESVEGGARLGDHVSGGDEKGNGALWPAGRGEGDDDETP